MGNAVGPEDNKPIKARIYIPPDFLHLLVRRARYSLSRDESGPSDIAGGTEVCAENTTVAWPPVPVEIVQSGEKPTLTRLTLRQRMMTTTTSAITPRSPRRETIACALPRPHPHRAHSLLRTRGISLERSRTLTLLPRP